VWFCFLFKNVCLVDIREHHLLDNNCLPIYIGRMRYLRNVMRHFWFCEDTCLFIIMDYKALQNYELHKDAFYH
jgi:hypothetical protein